MIINRDIFPIEEIDYNYLKYILSGYKNIRIKINDMLKKKEIIRIKKGLYVLGDAYSNNLYCMKHCQTLFMAHLIFRWNMHFPFMG